MEKSIIPERYKILASKWKQGCITPEEAGEFAAWYNMDQDREVLIPADFARDSDALNSMMFEVIREKTMPLKHISLWPRIAVAVAVTIILFGVGLFYFSKEGKQIPADQVVLQDDVAPGVSGATLTLASGQKIRLSDARNGELAQEAGVMITKSENGELVYELKGDTGDFGKQNTLSTAKGETYKLRLPDGSYVWLNSASSLTYTAGLVKGGKRSVELMGEGFFEVAKDKVHPFVVRTKGQQVEVLGTHFNVNAYPDEQVVATALLEGSVRLLTGGAQRVLKPGQLAVNDDGLVKVTEANMDAVMDWKNEEFFLDKLDFRMAMRKIARWYNIEVIYNGSVPENLKSGGWIPRSSKLSDVLRSIEATGQVHFKVEGRKLYVSK